MDIKPKVVGVDLARGPDVLAFFYAGRAMSASEFVAYVRGQFSQGAPSYEVDQSVLHALLDMAECYAVGRETPQ